MNTPPKSPAPTELIEGPPTTARFTQFLASKDRLSRLCLVVATGCLVIAAIAIAFAFQISRQPVLFVLLDPEGNVIPVRGSAFPEAREVHIKMAMLATTALLSRNPKGWDQPEFVQAMFSKTAFATANHIKETEARDFLERQIQQKPQIARIDAISTHNDEVQVEVTGEIARWGFI